ncbi:MAG: DUF2169 domain-containing protein [Desulfobacterales bacterium]
MKPPPIQLPESITIPFTTNNKTSYTAEAVFVQDKSIVAIVKATWVFTPDGEVYMAQNQQPLVYGDQYTGEPGESSLKYASDIVPEKRGTDIALTGHAYAPGKIAYSVETALQVGNIRKKIWVTGDRFWKWSILGVRPGRPQPFRKMPLVYERAFGGSDTLHKKEKKHGWCLENPAGTGFVAVKKKKHIKGLKLPNLENRKNEIKKWKHKPVPAGYGFIAPGWNPRIGYAGINLDNTDDNQQDPQLPQNLDPGFFNAAAPGLSSDPPLTGKETLILVNLHPASGGREGEV